MHTNHTESSRSTKHTGHLTETIMLWVDALCITHQDVEEKDRQIKMVPRNYNNITTVVAYLGADTDRREERKCLSLLKKLRVYHQNPERLEQEIGRFFLQHGRGPSDMFLNRQYVQRQWTIQERYYAAMNLTLRCGAKEIPRAMHWHSCLRDWRLMSKVSVGSKLLGHTVNLKP